MSYIDIHYVGANGSTIGDTSMNYHIHMAVDEYKATRSRSHPQCMICSTEDAIQNKSVKNPHPSNLEMVRRTKNIFECSNPNCNVIVHLCTHTGSKLHQNPDFFGFSCFQLSHHGQCTSLFTPIEREGVTYNRMVPSHQVAQDLLDEYKKELPHKIPRINTAHKTVRSQGRGRPWSNKYDGVSDISSSSRSSSRLTNSEESQTIVEKDVTKNMRKNYATKYMCRVTKTTGKREVSSPPKRNTSSPKYTRTSTAPRRSVRGSGPTTSRTTSPAQKILTPSERRSPSTKRTRLIRLRERGSI